MAVGVGNSVGMTVFSVEEGQGAAKEGWVFLLQVYRKNVGNASTFRNRRPGIASIKCFHGVASGGEIWYNEENT